MITILKIQETRLKMLLILKMRLSIVKIKKIRKRKIKRISRKMMI
jgi:hypothetical protein